MIIQITPMEVQYAVFEWIKNKGFDVKSFTDVRLVKTEDGEFEGYNITVPTLEKVNEKENMVQGQGSARMVPKAE